MAMSGKKQDMGRGVARNRNEGEGSRSAAKAYNEATRRYVEAGKPAKAAREAAKAMSSPEAAGLKAAEAKGRARARH